MSRPHTPSQIKLLSYFTRAAVPGSQPIRFGFGTYEEGMRFRANLYKLVVPYRAEAFPSRAGVDGNAVHHALRVIQISIYPTENLPLGEKVGISFPWIVEVSRKRYSSMAKLSELRVGGKELLPPESPEPTPSHPPETLSQTIVTSSRERFLALLAKGEPSREVEPNKPGMPKQDYGETELP